MVITRLLRMVIILPEMMVTEISPVPPPGKPRQDWQDFLCIFGDCSVKYVHRVLIQVGGASSADWRLTRGNFHLLTFLDYLKGKKNQLGVKVCFVFALCTNHISLFISLVLSGQLPFSLGPFFPMGLFVHWCLYLKKKKKGKEKRTKNQQQCWAHVWFLGFPTCPL